MVQPNHPSIVGLKSPNQNNIDLRGEEYGFRDLEVLGSKPAKDFKTATYMYC